MSGARQGHRALHRLAASVVRLIDDGGDEEWRGSLAALLKANDGEIDDLDEILALAPGQTHNIGGGAAALVTIEKLR